MCFASGVPITRWSYLPIPNLFVSVIDVSLSYCNVSVTTRFRVERELLVLRLGLDPPFLKEQLLPANHRRIYNHQLTNESV